MRGLCQRGAGSSSTSTTSAASVFSWSDSGCGSGCSPTDAGRVCLLGLTALVFDLDLCCGGGGGVSEVPPPTLWDTYFCGVRDWLVLSAAFHVGGTAFGGGGKLGGLNCSWCTVARLAEV